MADAAAHDPIVIAGYARTPMGGFQGALGPVKATDLGAVAVRAAVDRAGVEPQDIDQIVMGCVLPAGLGVAFDAPEEAVSPGQACVLYDAAEPSRVLGGGFIARD